MGALRCKTLQTYVGWKRYDTMPSRFTCGCVSPSGYLNSAVQCLSQTPLLQQALLHQKERGPTCRPGLDASNWFNWAVDLVVGRSHVYDHSSLMFLS